MPLHLPTLTFACGAMLALSALALAVYGAAAHPYRGYWWWTAAQAMFACGVALMPAGPSQPWLLPLINLLCLQWPITVLVGLRRHYARDEWRTPDWLDVLMLGLAYAAWFGAWASGANMGTRVVVFGVGLAVLSFYASALVIALRVFPHTLALKAFAFTALTAGTYQLVRAWSVKADATVAVAPELLLPGALVLGLTAVALVCMALLLTTERTEGNLLATQRTLRVLADIDVLTGMANRRHFLERCAQLLDEAAVARSTVVMFDIDHFKKVNDLLGHAVGDEALRQIGHSVIDALRGHDVAGRLGGDEFAVLLPDTSVADAMVVASRIAARLEHRQVAPRIAPMSLSFGVVQTQPGETITTALRRADQALYEAKRQGRSRAVAASGDEDQPVFSESRPMGLAS